MCFDEAGFGRISTPRECWIGKQARPSTPCHRVREYRYAYGAVDTLDGENFFLVLPRCDTAATQYFLDKLSEQYPEDLILLLADNASWHKAKALNVPKNIKFIFIPPYSPEMNPIEQIWKEIRCRGFFNVIFKTLNAVVDKLCEVINGLEHEVVKSITHRKWIISAFQN